MNAMIPQTIKRWLTRLFAWWPWQKRVEAGYVRPVRNTGVGLTQDSLQRFAQYGPLPQPGTTSVAVEQNTAGMEPKPLAPEKSPVSPHEERVSLPPITQAVENTHKERPTQQLEFLRYLVSRGVINEGFDEENTPQQYRKTQDL